MTSYLAGASGAALGYIVGNLPGAYYGYHLGRAMAPIRRKRPYPTPSSIRMKKFRTGSYRSSSSRTSTGTGMRSLQSALSHNSVVTRQHDYQGQYKYKRMPRYKKRRWVKFVKKVRAVQLKQSGLKTVVFNSSSFLANTPGNQSFITLALYGVAGSIDGVVEHGFNDLYRIFKNDPDIVQIGAAPGNVPKSGKLQFGSAVLDFTVRNLSPDFEAEVDIYFGWYKKDDDASRPKNQTNPGFVYQNAPSDLILPGNTATSLLNRGHTLFDKPAGLSATGYHITKKTKMLLAPGQTSLLQHRDAKNYMIDWTNVQDCGFAKRGLTFGVWIVFKPSVTATQDATVSLAVGVTRKFSYAVVEDNVDRIAFNPPN